MEEVTTTTRMPSFAVVTALFQWISMFLAARPQPRLCCMECYSCKRRFDAVSPSWCGTENRGENATESGYVLRICPQANSHSSYHRCFIFHVCFLSYYEVWEVFRSCSCPCPFCFVISCSVCLFVWFSGIECWYRPIFVFDVKFLMCQVDDSLCQADLFYCT